MEKNCIQCGRAFESFRHLTSICSDYCRTERKKEKAKLSGVDIKRSQRFREKHYDDADHKLRDNLRSIAYYQKNKIIIRARQNKRRLLASAALKFCKKHNLLP